MTSSALDRFLEKQEEARLGGGLQRIERQHAKGKLTARERVDLLLDKGSFQELDALVSHRATEFGLDQRRFSGDSVVTGWGEVDGRLVYVFAQDFTVLGGSVGEVHGQKICKIIDLALENGAPVVGLNDSGGARIQEGVDSLAAYGDIFYRNVLASGVIPQISVIMGPCAGGAVYSPALTDFTFMVERTGNMFITGPDVIKSVTHEDITPEELGGAAVHTRNSGVAHFSAGSERETLLLVRELLSFLPSNNAEGPPQTAPVEPPEGSSDRLDTLVPEDPSVPFDMHQVINCVLDASGFLEVHSSFATNLIVGFGRLAGNVVGVVAQQPRTLAGVLDIDASDKGARFIRFCDCFNIPILTFTDTPGFLPGVSQEHRGIIRHGAKMIYAYAEATAPKVSVIVRKAYGGAYIVMNSKHLRGDLCLAWPGAEIAVMGPESAVKVVFRRELAAATAAAEAAATAAATAAAEEVEQKRAQLVAEYRERFSNPFVAASRGYLDAIVAPHDTRSTLIRALRMLRSKRARRPAKKHGNIPL